MKRYPLGTAIDIRLLPRINCYMILPLSIEKLSITLHKNYEGADVITVKSASSH